MTVALRSSSPVLFAAVIAACAGVADAQTPSSPQPPLAPSIWFTRPAPGSVIANNSLPLEIETNASGADSLVSVEYHATYYTAGYTSGGFYAFHQRITDTLLHTEQSAPWQWIWDITGVQDHYHHRMILNATARTASGRQLHATTDDFVIDRTDSLSTRRGVAAQRTRTAPSLAIDPARPAQQYRNGDNTVTFQPSWSAESLFVVITVDDAAVVPADEDAAPEDSAWWYGDAVELFIDPSARRTQLVDTTTFQFMLNPQGRIYGGYLSLTLNPARFGGGISCERTSDGYAMRCAVAWSTLGRRPHKGDTLGFEVSNIDLDKPGGLFSVGTWNRLHIGNHHNSSEWGELILSAPRPRGAILAGLIAALAGALGATLWVLSRRIKAQRATVATVLQKKTSPLVTSIIDLVKAQYHDENLNLQSAADRLHKNPKYLSTLFKKETGQSFTTFLNGVRLEHADRLLRTTDMSISHIGLEVGYGSYKYFSAVYHKRFGVAPSDVRRGTNGQPPG